MRSCHAPEARHVPLGRFRYSEGDAGKLPLTAAFSVGACRRTLWSKRIAPMWRGLFEAAWRDRVTGGGGRGYPQVKGGYWPVVKYA
jgi:hypothetical protein